MFMQNETNMHVAHNMTMQRQTNAFSLIVLCIYFAISVFEPYLNGIVGSVTKYYIFITMFVIAYQNQGLLLPTKTAKAMVIWLAYKFISLLWSSDYSTPQLHYISQIGMVLFLIVLFSGEYNEDTFKWIEITYWISSGIIGVLSLFFSRSYREVFSLRQVLVVAGVETDPNNQAALLIIGVCISLINILYKKKWIIISIIILLINVYACFLTGSRAALITIAAISFFCILLPAEKGKITKTMGRVILVALFFLAALYLTKRLDSGIYNRLFGFQDYEEGSGRAELWRNVWSVYTRDLVNVLFGVGWGTASVATGMGESKGVHNTFLTMLCDVGLIGTLVFMIPLFIMAYRLIKKKNQFPVMLLIAQLIPSFFIDAINKRFFWNAIFILGMYYYHYISSPVEKANSHNKYIKN